MSAGNMVKLVIAVLVLLACYLLRGITLHEVVGVFALLVALHVSWVSVSLNQREEET